METGYVVNVDGEKIIVVASNISDACDKLEKCGYLEYEFEYSRSLDIVV